MKQNNGFSYIGADYFSLILRIAANNATFYNDNTWELYAVGSLLNQSQMMSLMKYDDQGYMDTSFIATPYQWLYVYQQLANACNIIINMSDIIDLSSWHHLGMGDWTNSVSTYNLKVAAKNLLMDFASIAVFPDLQNEWLLFFELLKKHNFGCKTFNSFETLINYDANQDILLTSEGTTINYYDILRVTVSEESYQHVKHLKKLCFDNYTSYFVAQSISGNKLNK